MKNFVLGAVLVGLALVAGLLLKPPANFGASSGPDHYNQENFFNGVRIGTAAATVQTIFRCNTATWNPGSLASSSVDGVSATTTDIALTGAVVGDTCEASLTSATSTAAHLFCDVNGTATGTIKLVNLGSSALDLATGTAKVCYRHTI